MLKLPVWWNGTAWVDNEGEVVGEHPDDWPRIFEAANNSLTLLAQVGKNNEYLESITKHCRAALKGEPSPGECDCISVVELCQAYRALVEEYEEYKRQCSDIVKEANKVFQNEDAILPGFLKECGLLPGDSITPAITKLAEKYKELKKQHLKLQEAHDELKEDIFWRDSPVREALVNERDDLKAMCNVANGRIDELVKERDDLKAELRKLKEAVPEVKKHKGEVILRLDDNTQSLVRRLVECLEKQFIIDR